MIMPTNHPILPKPSNNTKILTQRHQNRTRPFISPLHLRPLPQHPSRCTPRRPNLPSRRRSGNDLLPRARPNSRRLLPPSHPRNTTLALRMPTSPSHRLRDRGPLPRRRRRPLLNHRSRARLARLRSATNPSLLLPSPVGTGCSCRLRGRRSSCQGAFSLHCGGRGCGGGG